MSGNTKVVQCDAVKEDGVEVTTASGAVFKAAKVTCAVVLNLKHCIRNYLQRAILR